MSPQSSPAVPQDISAEVARRLGLERSVPLDELDDSIFPEPDYSPEEACCRPWILQEEPLPDLMNHPCSAEMEFAQGINRDTFDLMERMLKRLHKREDPKPLADRMRMYIGTAHSLFRLDRYVYQQLGVNHLDALFFSLIPSICRYVATDSYGEHPQVGHLETACPYVSSNFIGLKEERFYLYCLNTRGALKTRILLNEGIEDRALLSMNKLVLEILHYQPSAIILAHNHPGGTLRPSDADIGCTWHIIEALQILKVPLLDHLIVTNTRTISMRENGFVPERVWMRQNPKHFLLRNWLLPPPPKKPPKPKVLTPEQQAAALQRQMRIERNKRIKHMKRAMGEYRRSVENAKKAMRVYRRLQRIEEAYLQQFPDEKD